MYLGQLAEIPSSYGNFDRIAGPFSVDTAANIRVAKWQSRVTGLSVVWSEIESPIVHGCLTVPTEAFTDSGTPHTLEHLIFFGSENYPHKGLGYTLASRAFGANMIGYTHQTHTDYTFDTAGSDGFLRMLPVYLDHILYPTLTPQSFMTEVYHLNSKGKDGGVVHNEIQAKENTSGFLMDLRNKQHLYPLTSAYRSAAGGLMEPLRKLTLEEIKEFHEKYYHPHNLQLVVAGKIEPTALLKLLQDEVEPLMRDHGQDKVPEGWKRPFLETASQAGARMTESKKIEVEFPAEDESTGEVKISWVGPSANDALERGALAVVGLYLTDPALSALSKELIETDLCTGIEFLQDDGANVIITADLSAVRHEHLDTISESFEKILADNAKEVDIERMRMIIKRQALRGSWGMENMPHEFILPVIKSNFVYGENHHLQENLMSALARLKTLADWTATEWSTFIKKWLVDAPRLTVVGRPSAALVKNLNLKAKWRTKAIRKKYGYFGLQKKGVELSNAIKVNERPIPDHLISDFKIPSIKSIHWINVEVAQAGKMYKSPLQSHIDQNDPTNLPFFVQFNHIKSDFLSISVNLSPKHLTPELLELLPTYENSFFRLPLKRKDGLRLQHEDVIRQLKTDTVSYGISMGYPTSQTLQVSLIVEKSKYADGIGLLRDLLWGSEFDVHKLRAEATQTLQNLPSSKRDGECIADSLYLEMLYSAELAPVVTQTLFKLEALQHKVVESLQAESSAILLQQRMEQLRATLLTASSMRICVIGDIRNLKEPKATWLKHFERLEPAELENPLMANQVLGKEAVKPSGKAVVAVVPSIESTYSYHIGKGPQGYLHADQAALKVALSVLNACEGPFWRAVRGPGLAYDVGAFCDIESGIVALRIWKSSDPFKAFMESRNTVNELISQEGRLTELVVETAKSSVIFYLAESQKSETDAAKAVFRDLGMNGLQADATKLLLDQVQHVKPADVLRVIKQYIQPIFDSKHSSVVVATSMEQGENIIEDLKNFGYSVEPKEISGDASEKGGVENADSI